MSGKVKKSAKKIAKNSAKKRSLARDNDDDDGPLPPPPTTIRSSPPNVDVVESFAAALDKCNGVSPLFRKAKIDPIRADLENARREDTLITLVAETGFGKTRMVNCILGDDKLFPERDSGELFSCTMLPVIIGYGDSIQLLKRRFTDEGGAKSETLGDLKELRERLSSINGEIKEEYEATIRPSHQSLNLSYDFLEVFVPMPSLRIKQLQIVDFPGMTAEHFSAHMGAHNRAMLNYISGQGRYIGAFFIGCHRNSANPFLALHDHERKLIDWYGFFSRESIIRTPLICLVDNVWQGALETVNRCTSSPDFFYCLREQFIACVTGERKRQITDEMLRNAGITSFGDDYSPIFSSLYHDQFWTLHRKSPKSLIPVIRNLFSYINVHAQPTQWMTSFDEIVAKARRNSLLTTTRALFNRFCLVLQSTKRFRPISADPAATHPPSILDILRNNDAKKINASLFTLLLNYCRSEYLDVDWGEAAVGSEDSWKIFVSNFVEGFLFSDLYGSLPFLYGTILAQRFHDTDNEDYFVNQLAHRLTTGMRLRIDWLQDLACPRPDSFTLDHENLFRNFANFHEHPHGERLFKQVVGMLATSFNLGNRVYEIGVEARQLSDDISGSITQEVVATMALISRDPDFKRFKKEILASINLSAGSIVGEADDNANIVMRDHSLTLTRFQPSTNASTCLSYCPSSLHSEILSKPSIDFTSNEEVKERYLRMRQSKVFHYNDKFYKSAIFFRENDVDAYRLANSANITVQEGFVCDLKTIELEIATPQSGVVRVAIENISIRIDHLARIVQVSGISQSLRDRIAPVFIPSYLVADSANRLRKVNYFLDSILSHSSELDRNEKVGPFIVVVEYWQLNNVLAEIKRQILKVAVALNINQDAINRHFYIMSVHNRHIGVGRARDLCRLMAVYVNAKHFFILHDDISTIVEFDESSAATYKDSFIPIKGLRCMVDVLETEYLDWRAGLSARDQNDIFIEIRKTLGLNMNDIGDFDVGSALRIVMRTVVQDPGLLRPGGTGLEELLAKDYSAIINQTRFGQLPTVIRNAFSGYCNRAICQVALLSSARQKAMLNDASKRRAKGVTHGLSSMLYECTLYRTEPCRNFSFLSGDSFFDPEAEAHYSRFTEYRENMQEFMPIHGWDNSRIPNLSALDEASTGYYDALKLCIRYGYRYEDHAFHERLMLRGYTGVVLYNYQMVPFDKQVSAAFDHNSIGADGASIASDVNDEYDYDDTELYLALEG